jgi:shikimate dehydrogenase
MLGSTRVHWMIGSPITQVHMPALATHYFEQHHRDEALVPIEVPLARLDAALSVFATARNVCGLLSTLPHKASLSARVDGCSERSALLGVVNTVRKQGTRLIGDIFDGEGVVSALSQAGVSLRGADVAVIGCGGLGSAAACAVLERKAACVSLIDVDTGRALSLAELLGQRFGKAKAQACAAPPPHCQVLLHCSPVGMGDDDAMPCDLEPLQRLLAVVDGAASKTPTALMRAAASRKLIVVEGSAIAQAQLKHVIDFWDTNFNLKETTHDA